MEWSSINTGGVILTPQFLLCNDMLVIMVIAWLVSIQIIALLNNRISTFSSKSTRFKQNLKSDSDIITEPTPDLI